MAQRLMTPFCFASLLAAALVAEGALPLSQLPATPADAWATPMDALGGPEVTSEDPALPPIVNLF